MGNCNFSDTIKETKDKDSIINRSHFNFLYAIGKGGFGRVWKVEKKNTKIILAMKEMSKVKIYEKNSINCIINERKLLAHLRHSFIINMHNSFQDREYLYIVLDYLSGGDLRYHICKQKKFSEEQSKFFIACVILALEYLHYNNIIHRDIKPENLVFDNNGFLHLTDMGIARLYRKDKTIIDSSGTPGYMAPEVITNQPHDLCSDFFAIGIMTYEFMFGRRPYIGKSRKEIKEQIISREINVKVNEIPNGWSTEAADFLNKLLKRKSNNRLGKNGIYELKEHAWLKNFPWLDLYKKEYVPPFIPKSGDNFDVNYCNKVDPKDETTYDFALNKINEENYFDNFYFDFKTNKDKEKYFELDGENFSFINIHEEKIEKSIKTTIRKPTVTNASTNLLINKFYENVTSVNLINNPINRSNSLTIHRKIFV